MSKMLVTAAIVATVAVGITDAATHNRKSAVDLQIRNTLDDDDYEQYVQPLRGRPGTLSEVQGLGGEYIRVISRKQIAPDHRFHRNYDEDEEQGLGGEYVRIISREQIPPNRTFYFEDEEQGLGGEYVRIISREQIAPDRRFYEEDEEQGLGGEYVRVISREQVPPDRTLYFEDEGFGEFVTVISREEIPSYIRTHTFFDEEEDVPMALYTRHQLEQDGLDVPIPRRFGRKFIADKAEMLKDDNGFISNGFIRDEQRLSLVDENFISNDFIRQEQKQHLTATTQQRDEPVLDRLRRLKGMMANKTYYD